MAKKHDKIEVKHVPTKRQLSRHRRQERIQHIIYISGAVFLVALVAFLGWAYWNVQIKPYREPAVKVNGTTYDMNYYIDFLNAYTMNQDAAQISSTANGLPDLIHYNLALIAAAPELGYSVSKDDVNSVLKTAGLPDTQANRDAVTASLLSNELQQDYFNKKVPASVVQVEAQALLTESIDIANSVEQRLAAGDNFTSLASEYSVEQLTRDNGGNLGWLPQGFTDIILGGIGSSAIKDIPFTLQAGQVSEPTFDGTISKMLGYWVVQVTEKDPTKGSHARGILTGSRHDAEAIREKMLAGDDFAGLVKDYSQDPTSSANGGDLGWTGEGGMTNRLVMGLAMPLDVNAVSEPGADSSVKTIGGFWVVKVVNRDDNKTIDSSTRQTLVRGLFDNWIASKMTNGTVEKLLTDEQKTWAINEVTKKRG